MLERRPLARRPLRAASAVVMVACAVGFGLVYVVANRTAWGQFVDERVFLVLYDFVPTGWPVDGLAFVARDVVIVVLAAAAALLAGMALIQGQRLTVVRVVAVTAAAVVSTPWLRDEVLRRQSFESEAFPLNSMPSTHASAAAALVLTVVLLWPRLRPWWLAKAAGVVLGVVALGNIVGQAHRPSDVAASFLLVLGLTAGTYALTGVPAARDVREPRDR